MQQKSWISKNQEVEQIRELPVNNQENEQHNIEPVGVEEYF
jgi:hypothetical protein